MTKVKTTKKIIKEATIYDWIFEFDEDNSDSCDYSNPFYLPEPYQGHELLLYADQTVSLGIFHKRPLPPSCSFKLELIDFSNDEPKYKEIIFNERNVQQTWNENSNEAFVPYTYYTGLDGMKRV